MKNPQNIPEEAGIFVKYACQLVHARVVFHHEKSMDKDKHGLRVCPGNVN